MKATLCQARLSCSLRQKGGQLGKAHLTQALTCMPSSLLRVLRMEAMTGAVVVGLPTMAA